MASNQARWGRTKEGKKVVLSKAAMTAAGISPEDLKSGTLRNIDIESAKDLLAPQKQKQKDFFDATRPLQETKPTELNPNLPESFKTIYLQTKQKGETLANVTYKKQFGQIKSLEQTTQLTKKEIATNEQRLQELQEKTRIAEKKLEKTKPGTLEAVRLEGQIKNNLFAQDRYSQITDNLYKTLDTIQQKQEGIFAAIKQDLLAKYESTRGVEADRLLANLSLTSTSKAFPLQDLKKEARDFLVLMGPQNVSFKKIEIKQDIGGRSQYEHSKKTITVQTDKKNQAEIKVSLFHELAHNLERNKPAILQLSTAFLLSRAEDQKPVSLKELIPFGKYGENEKAFKGNFSNPYIGKLYTDGRTKKINATEVISMGVQSFGSPSNMRALYQADPEHFKIMLGLIGD